MGRYEIRRWVCMHISSVGGKKGREKARYEREYHVPGAR